MLNIFSCFKSAKNSLTFKGIVKDYEKYLNERKEPIEEPIEEPEKKHKFTEKARQENKNKYQHLRKET